MSSGTKIFLIAFLISLPFWWGVNILSNNLDTFFLAQISQPLEGMSLVEMPLRTSKLEIKAESAISVKANKEGIQRVLFEKDIEQSLPIASLTKLMTAIIVLENPEDYQPFHNDLIASMLIESNNEAADALAATTGTEKFIDLMNRKSEELGLKETEFFNPTGLDPLDQLEGKNSSSSEDLAKLAQYILAQHPIIFEISSHQNQVLGEEISSRLVANRNDLLDPSSEIVREDEWWLEEVLLKIVGGKTGYTRAAGGCILLVLRDKEETYFINVILGADSIESRFEEMKKLVKFLD